MTLRIALLLLVAAPLGGCLNWQSTYDNAAWRACESDPDDAARRACLDRTTANSREQRAEQRDRLSASPK